MPRAVIRTPKNCAMRTDGIKLKDYLYNLASDYNQKLIKMISEEGFEKNDEKIKIMMQMVDDIKNIIAICKERNRF